MKGETRPRPLATAQDSLCSSPSCLLNLPSMAEFPETLKMGKRAASQHTSTRRSHKLVQSHLAGLAWWLGSLHRSDGLQVSLWAEGKTQGVAIHLYQCAEENNRVGHGAKRSPSQHHTLNKRTVPSSQAAASSPVASPVPTLGMGCTSTGPWPYWCHQA